jgi:hypothetical protein
MDKVKLTRQKFYPKGHIDGEHNMSSRVGLMFNMRQSIATMF